jgi:ABC-type metal ion transport system substrate-binding protein
MFNFRIQEPNALSRGFSIWCIEKLAIFSKKIEKLANLQQGKKKPKIVLS